jgi:hypothetical protein
MRRVHFHLTQAPRYRRKRVGRMQLSYAFFRAWFKQLVILLAQLMSIDR